MKNWILGICALTMAAALPVSHAADEFSPETVAGATTVDTSKAKELFDKGVLFVDVRSPKDWDAGRIPGAQHMDNHKGAFTDEALSAALGGKDKEVVLYCNGHKCMRSSQAAIDALKWGYKNVYYYRDGFPAWQGAGNPVE